MNQTYYRAYRQLYGRRHHGEETKKETFQRDQLPNPSTYYQEHLADEIRAGSGWVDAKCPFHDDSRASLSVNLGHGGFTCHACGASGGDVLDFHRKLNGLAFEEAAKELGAWN